MSDALADASTLLATYALGYDTQDSGMVADCFHEDGTFELLLPDGQTLSFAGRSTIRDFMQEQLDGQDDLRRHFTVNLRVVESAEDRMVLGSYLLLGAVDVSGLHMVASGRYDDVIEWHGGRAVFRSRHLTMDGSF